MNAEAVSKYMIFLSTLSLRRATDIVSIERCNLKISIHALLAESDVGRAESCWLSYGFLSTLSLRRATAESPRGLHKR